MSKNTLKIIKLIKKELSKVLKKLDKASYKIQISSIPIYQNVELQIKRAILMAERHRLEESLRLLESTIVVQVVTLKPEPPFPESFSNNRISNN